MTNSMHDTYRMFETYARTLFYHISFSHSHSFSTPRTVNRMLNERLALHRPRYVHMLSYFVNFELDCEA